MPPRREKTRENVLGVLQTGHTSGSLWGDFSEASKEDNIIDIEDADFDEIIPEEKHES